jgi:16S rRNA (cytosine1402-N4)-methyltransferase
LYVDATIGGGGHSEMILDRLKEGLLIGIDLDCDALAFAQKRLGANPNLRLVHGNFANLPAIVNAFPEAEAGVAGIIFDLGASRHQLVSTEAGFSYLSDAPLDMRFDRASGSRTALDLIRSSSETELGRLLRDFGEERFQRRISRHVYQARRRIKTTGDLADAIRAAVPSRFWHKSLMRVFQALRIAVNRELENLAAGLRQAVGLLRAGGRVVVLSYHSLEDRIAKQTFRELAQQGVLEILTRKPVRPSPEEVAANASARSARLRVAEKRKPQITQIAREEKPQITQMVEEDEEEPQITQIAQIRKRKQSVKSAKSAVRFRTVESAKSVAEVRIRIWE